jgi:hypothetical protein
MALGPGLVVPADGPRLADRHRHDGHARVGSRVVQECRPRRDLREDVQRDDRVGMPSMTAELSTRAVLSVVASVVEGSKQGDIPDAVKSRLLV